MTSVDLSCFPSFPTSLVSSYHSKWESLDHTGLFSTSWLHLKFSTKKLPICCSFCLKHSLTLCHYHYCLSALNSPCFLTCENGSGPFKYFPFGSWHDVKPYQLRVLKRDCRRKEFTSWFWCFICQAFKEHDFFFLSSIWPI